MTDNLLSSLRAKLKMYEKDLIKEQRKIKDSIALLPRGKARKEKQAEAVKETLEAVQRLKVSIEEGNIKSKEEQEAAIEQLKKLEDKMNDKGVNVQQPIRTTIKQLYNKANRINACRPIVGPLVKFGVAAIPIAAVGLLSLVGLPAIAAAVSPVLSWATLGLGVRAAVHTVHGWARNIAMRPEVRNSGKTGFLNHEDFEPLYDKAYSHNNKKPRGWLNALRINLTKKRTAGRVFENASEEIEKFEALEPARAGYGDHDHDHSDELSEEKEKERINALSNEITDFITKVNVRGTPTKEDIEQFLQVYNILLTRGAADKGKIPNWEMFELVGAYLNLASRVYSGNPLDDKFYTDLEEFLKLEGKGETAIALLATLAPNLRDIIMSRALVDERIDKLFEDYEKARTEGRGRGHEGDHGHDGGGDDDDHGHDGGGDEGDHGHEGDHEDEETKGIDQAKLDEMLTNIVDNIFNKSLTLADVEALGANIGKLRNIAAKKGLTISPELNAKLNLCDKYLGIIRKIHYKTFDDEFYTDLENFVNDDNINFRTTKDNMIYNINLSLVDAKIKNDRIAAIMKRASSIRKENSYGLSAKQRELLNRLSKFNFASMTAENYKKARELSDDLQREMRINGEEIYLDEDSRLELAELDSYINAYTAQSQISKCIRTCKGIMSNRLAFTTDEAKQDAFETCMKYYHDIIGYTGITMGVTNRGKGTRKTAVATAVQKHLLTVEDLTALRDIMNYYKENFEVSRKGAYLDEQLDAYGETAGRKR